MRFLNFFCEFFIIILCKFAQLLPNYSVNADLEEGFQLKFLEVPIDHFSSENPNPTFKLHYAINNKYWNEQYGAIFFYCGCRDGLKNEKIILPNFAEVFNALVIYADHRYYGDSMPFGDKSLKEEKYFKYLSTRQVLEDFVDLLFYVKTGTIRTIENASEFNTGRNPVIAFGGSYTGMLAAWFRKKYPHIIEGSLASSAPMLAHLVDCNVHAKKMTAIYEETVKGCPNLIRQSWVEISKIISSDFGKEWFYKNWNLCTKIENLLDVKTFKMWLSYELWEATYSSSCIKKLCGSIKNESNSKDILMSIHSYIYSISSSKTEKGCLDFAKMTAWDIQSCLELVQPECTDGVNDMFEPEPWDFQSKSDYCYYLFKVRPIPNYIENEYGTINKSNTSNIIFSNGDMDMWSVGGILKNVSKSLIAIQIPGGTHCRDLQKPRSTDSYDLKIIRNKYKMIFQKWIYNFYKQNGNKDIEKKYPLNLQISRQEKIISALKNKSKTLVVKFS